MPDSPRSHGRLRGTSPATIVSRRPAVHGDRDRSCQAGPPRVLVRRHRHRAEPPHPRPRGGLGRLADRRLPVRAPGRRRADGLGDVAGDRDRVRQARRPRRARPGGSVDPVRRPASRCWRSSAGCDGAGARPGGCRRSTPNRPAGPDRRAARRDPRRRRDRRRRAVAAADRGSWPGGRRRRGRPVRDPGYDGLGRARLRPGRAAEPQAVHLRARRAGDRRRLRRRTRPRCT